MKSKFFYIFCSLVSLIFSGAQLSAHDETPTYDLHDEHDKTDIFAIQLDSSEEELAEEEDELEGLEKYEQQHKG